MFEPHSQRYGPFLVWGSMQPTHTGFRLFGAIFGAVLRNTGNIVELEATKGSLT